MYIGFDSIINGDMTNVNKHLSKSLNPAFSSGMYHACVTIWGFANIRSLPHPTFPFRSSSGGEEGSQGEGKGRQACAVAAEIRDHV